MNHYQTLRRIRWLTGLFILGLWISGATAIPLLSEVNGLANVMGVGATPWLGRIREALVQTQAHYPFLFYGTDWLAFGHFIIGLFFIGAWRDPVRNRWLYEAGMIACFLVIPYALVFGGFRGIPIWWRLIDCSFGILGFIPLWLCHCWTGVVITVPSPTKDQQPLHRTGRAPL